MRVYNRGSGGLLKLKHFACERSMEAANLPIFLKFENAEIHRYLHCFSKKMQAAKRRHGLM